MFFLYMATVRENAVGSKMLLSEEKQWFILLEKETTLKVNTAFIYLLLFLNTTLALSYRRMY